MCSFLAGLTIAPVFSCQYALIGRAVTPGVETEAFTWVSAALISGLAAGSALGGAAVGALGVSAPFVIACAVTGTGGAVGGADARAGAAAGVIGESARRPRVVTPVGVSPGS